MQNSPSIQDIAAVCTAIAATCTAVLTGLLGWYARRGLNQWRDTLKGQASFDLARKMILQAYDFRDNYHVARSPMAFRGEGTDRPKTEDESPDKAIFRNESYARRKRIEILREAFLPLRTSKIEAKHILNSDIPLLVTPLELALRDLAVALMGYYSEQSESQQLVLDRLPASDGQKQQWLERREKWQELIYGTEDDIYGQAVNKAVDALIAGLEPFLK